MESHWLMSLHEAYEGCNMQRSKTIKNVILFISISMSIDYYLGGSKETNNMQFML